MSIVRKTLQETLSDFAALHTPVLTIAYEGVPFEKPSNNPYLECYLIPAATIDVTVDGTRQREVGIFRVNVWVKDGKGTKQGEDIVSEIKALYPLVPQNFTVAITSTPSVSSSITDSNGWRCWPVSIRYRAEIE